MNPQTEALLLTGAAGAIEVAVDRPSGASRGVVVIAHPHPLFAGTMQNKVVQTLARAFVQCGWTAVRFNFRGVGESEGTHDEGRGEIDDFLAVLAHVAPADQPPPALALAGFSFGAYVATHAMARLQDQRPVDQLVLVGTSVSRAPAAPIAPVQHLTTLVIHGEVDDTVALSAVLDWARPQALPITVVPGGGHFFHGQLPLLKNLVMRHIGASPH